MSEAKSQLNVTDNVEVSVHDAEILQQNFPDWNSYSNQQKLKFSREVEPVRQFSTSNTACVGLLEQLVDELDDTQSDNQTATHCALGDDDSTTPSSSDTNLNNEVNRFSITTHIDNGSTLDTSTFIDSSQGNGDTYNEVGLTNQSTVSGDILYNHSLINEVDKSSSKTITVDVSLSFQAA